MGELIFYGTLGVASAEVLGTVKATKCVGGFSLDTGFQMGINAIVKRYLNESFTTRQLMKEVSFPSAGTSCLTSALVDNCGTACAGVSGFAVGFGDDVVNQLKSGKSLSEVEISQSTLNGIKQGILNIVVQKVVTFGISKFSAWRGKYTAKQVEDALEDLQAHPEKYGVANEVEKLTSKIVDETKKYFIDGLEIGSARISNAGYVGFDIRIPAELQKQGYATKVFEDAIGYYKSQNKVINGIEGRWLSSNSYEGGMSTNLKSFIDDFLYNGKTFEEAALNTPTGKIAAKNGFTKVIKNDWDVLDLGGNKPSEIYWVELKFKKP